MALTDEQIQRLTAPRTPPPPPAAEMANQSLRDAADTDPDQYAADVQLGQETGIDPLTTSRNRDEVRKIKYLNDLQIQKLSETPKTQEWLVNTDNAKIAKDDIALLQEFERESNRSWYELDDRTFEGFGDSFMISQGKMYDQAMIDIMADMQSLDFETGDLLKKPLMQIMTDQMMSWSLDLALGDQRQALNEELKAREEKHLQNLEFADSLLQDLMPEDLTMMEEGARGGLQMAADMAPGMLISLFTRGKINPTLGYLTGKTYLESYGSGRLGGLEHDTAKKYAGIDAAIEFATEKIPTKSLEKVFGDIGKGGMKGGLKRWMLEEALTEQGATAFQSLNAYMHDLDDELAGAQGFEEVIEIQSRRQAVTFLSTLFGGGAMSGAAKGIDYVANRQRRAFATSLKATSKIVGSEQEQGRLSNLVHLAQGSKTNERAKEVFDDFMESTAADQTVYIDAQAIEDLEDPPQYLVAQLDGSTGTVEMTMAQFLSEFATNEDALAIVRPHVRTQENLQTASELSENPDSEHIKNILERASKSKAAKDEADTIFEQVRDQLVATRRQGQQTSNQSAVLVPALVVTQYEELKSRGVTNKDGSEITVAQLFEDMNYKVIGPEVDLDQAAQVFNQDDVPDEQKALVKGLSLLPSVDDATLMAAAFQSPEGDVSQNTQLMDHFAKKAGYKNAAEYNKALLEEDAAYDAMLKDPAQLMVQANTQPNAYLTIAHAVSERRGLRMLRDREERKKIEDALSDMTEAELIEVIQEEFKGDNVIQMPRVLKQQNFGDITLTEAVVDEAGNAYTLTESATALWAEQQARSKILDQLKECAGA